MLPHVGLMLILSCGFADLFYDFIISSYNHGSQRAAESRGRSCQLCEVKMLTGQGAAKMLDFCIAMGTLVR